jgi:hypothetical protein
MVAIGGDRGNLVPRYRVTPAELLLLRALHGVDAVTDVQVLGAELDSPNTSRQERERLHDYYKRTAPGREPSCPELNALFPGVAARLPETFEELELDDSLYIATARATPRVAPVEAEPEAPKPSKRSRKVKAETEEADTPQDEANILE